MFVEVLAALVFSVIATTLLIESESDISNIIALGIPVFMVGSIILLALGVI